MHYGGSYKMNLLYSVKNDRIAIAWELFTMVYQSKLPKPSFLFGNYLFMCASRLVGTDSKFESHHFKFTCNLEEIYEAIGVSGSTFRQKSKVTGLTPTQELEKIGFIFEHGENISERDRRGRIIKQFAKKGNVYIPLFSNVTIEKKDIVVDTFHKNCYGKEETIQHILMLNEKARNKGKLFGLDEIDYKKENRKNYLIIDSDSDELKKSKVRKYYFFLLNKKGLSPLDNLEEHLKQVNELITYAMKYSEFIDLLKVQHIMEYYYLNEKPYDTISLFKVVKNRMYFKIKKTKEFFEEFNVLYVKNKNDVRKSTKLILALKEKMTGVTNIMALQILDKEKEIALTKTNNKETNELYLKFIYEIYFDVLNVATKYPDYDHSIDEWKEGGLIPTDSDMSTVFVNPDNFGHDSNFETLYDENLLSI